MNRGRLFPQWTCRHGQARTGSVNLDIDLGNDSSMIIQTLHGNFHMVDAAAPGGVAITPAFRITLFENAEPVFANGFD